LVPKNGGESAGKKRNESPPLLLTPPVGRELARSGENGRGRTRMGPESFSLGPHLQKGGEDSRTMLLKEGTEGMTPLRKETKQRSV